VVRGWGALIGPIVLTFAVLLELDFDEEERLEVHRRIWLMGELVVEDVEDAVLEGGVVMEEGVSVVEEGGVDSVLAVFGWLLLLLLLSIALPMV
jgi:hypothetical protein